MNVIGVLVQTVPEREAEVATRLTEMPGVEIHAGTGDGRLVVTATDVGEHFASDSLMAMSLVPHVVATSLVYHAHEPEISEPEAGARAA
ncbi:MAG: chaperone NapD [Siculibacillus sp.]|nr:chaperone NapD [Siculibacillus sp.]